MDQRGDEHQQLYAIPAVHVPGETPIPSNLIDFPTKGVSLKGAQNSRQGGNGHAGRNLGTGNLEGHQAQLPLRLDLDRRLLRLGLQLRVAGNVS